MKQNKARYVIAGVLLAALQMLVSCSRDNGTSSPPNNQNLTLSISGTLTPTDLFVSPDHVRVLLDGQPVSDEGCHPLECSILDVTANTITTRGSHSVEFEILSQICGSYPLFAPCRGGQKYRVSGNVTVSNSSGVIQEIPLDNQTVALAEGDKVSWQIDIK